jgi:hypothetical protein
MSATWVYKVQPIIDGGGQIEDDFNKLGEKGWELVTVMYHPNPKSVNAEASTPYFGIFKKLKD